MFGAMLQQNPELARQIQEQYGQLGASLNPNPSASAPRHALVKPKPGFVVKTKDEAGQKVFVNLCSSERVRQHAFPFPSTDGRSDRQKNTP